MKLVKNFALAVLLALGIAINATNAIAGEVPMPGAIPPPPPATIRTDDTTKIALDGEPNAPVVVTVETSDYLFFEALAALLSVY